ncbi:hypothetical protein BJX65DRAFT_260752 [Aspergillus insuetus]
MAICITFGTHEFTSMLEGYENVRAYCYNCQHWNGRCITRWPFFTICFVPLIPLSTHKYKEVTCYTCRFTQDMRYVHTPHTISHFMERNKPLTNTSVTAPTSIQTRGRHQMCTAHSLRRRHTMEATHRSSNSSIRL